MSHNRRRMLGGWQRPIALGVAAMAFAALCLMPMSSVVWATPQQNRALQTIPEPTPTPIPNWDWIGWPAGNPPDYARSGMPDLDQKQEDWHQGASPEVWTYCAPVAMANALWWLDSKFESQPSSPPLIADSHRLLQSYNPTQWDDHDAQNVVPLVNDLATRLGTQVGGASPGTEVSSAVPALQAYLTEVGLQNTYTLALVEGPSFEQLHRWVQRDAGVVLLLGFWEDQGDQWAYLGAHFVTLAGTEPLNRFLALSDPYRDCWEAGECVMGESPEPHPYPHGPEKHNDARFASHDAYRTVSVQGSGGSVALDSYLQPFAGVPNFAGQNVAQAYRERFARYSGSLVHTKVDYAIVIERYFAFQLHLPVIVKGAR